MSSNIVKGSFIKFTSENTRVIDSHDLVKKRMDDFSGVLRERENAMPGSTGKENAENYGFSDDVISELTGDNSFAEADEGFKEISFGASAEHIDTEGVGTHRAEYEEPIILKSDEVRAECEEMIAKANASAEEIRTMARIEADKIKETARNDGYANGLEEGREAGLAEYNLAMQELENVKKSLIEQYEQTLAELEPKMVEIISSIYEHVFGAGLFNRQDVVVHLLNRALTTVNADEGIFIFVSNSDYEKVLEKKEQVIAKTALREVPDIRMRDDLSAGQAIIETSYGILDCSIDTELSELEKMLKMLSYERRG